MVLLVLFFTNFKRYIRRTWSSHHLLNLVTVMVLSKMGLELSLPDCGEATQVRFMDGRDSSSKYGPVFDATRSYIKKKSLVVSMEILK